MTNQTCCCDTGAQAKLQGCDGIGAVTAAKICTGWAAGRGTREAEKFLHDMGLTMAQAHQVESACNVSPVPCYVCCHRWRQAQGQ
jgi:hypothetical protein